MYRLYLLNNIIYETLSYKGLKSIGSADFILSDMTKKYEKYYI